MTSTTSALPTAALPPLVDALVATPLEALSVVELQARYAALVPQVARLTGWLGAVQAELHTRTGGQVDRDTPSWALRHQGVVSGPGSGWQAQPASARLASPDRR